MHLQSVMHAKKSLLLLFAVVCALALVATGWQVGTWRARADLREQGQRQLQLMAPDLQSLLQKHETLPFVLRFQPDLLEALAQPSDQQAISRLNGTLKTIQQQANVDAIYVMDRDGLTLGASNWDQPRGFVGKNFSFRPYFQAAVHARAGRFYGIGTTTSEAGYFISQPVYGKGSGGGPLAGVVTVKISLADFERTWASSEDTIALADRAKVIFLSNRPGWKYHSIGKLDAETELKLARTQQYMGQHVTPLSVHPDLFVTRPVGELGWQLMLFPAQSRVVRAGFQWASVTALLICCIALSGWAIYQRHRRLQEGRESRAALQRAELELNGKIVERTRQLRTTNQHLEDKYAKLQETQHLLRSTQNELVQAGKLAMLGQMATGITHELNQPLAAIRAFADNARVFLERGQCQQAASNLGHIGEASARMGAIIGQLKGFARKDEAIATVDLAASVRASAFLMAGEYRRHDVTLQIDAPDNITVKGDSVRIEQVLINLLRNALDAVENAEYRVVAITLAREDYNAVICISDSGAGIPEQVVAHLFEPFFTTKPSGKGLGLGLAISSSIAQAMTGQLTAHNQAGGGARFELRLPLQLQGV
jgi:two-component system C4-dicarboxylate transport sensor histidine kinase DctB